MWVLALSGLALGAGLEHSGSCPGAIELAASGTPGGSFWFVAGDTLGPASVPVGPCAGTELGVGSSSGMPRVFGPLVDRDGDGRIAFEPTLPEVACGLHVVVVDQATCEVSAPVTLGAGEPVGNCDVPTPWESIATELASAPDLPELPGENLPRDWDDEIPSLVLHTIAPRERLPEDGYPVAECGLPDWWDTDQLQVGAQVLADDPADDHCRVMASASAVKPELYFNTRHPTGSIHVPITGEPAWVRMRFPVPPGHEAVSLTYSVNWSRLFGSHPTECHETDLDADGLCSRPALSADESWEEEVPPGLFLLWGRSTDCEGWWITGPHEPAGTASWSGVEDVVVDVPESLQGVDELSVSLLVYHQYPGGCDGDYCVPAESTYSNLGFMGATLRTEEVFAPPEEPPLSHPRLLGDDPTWLAELEAFDSLPCRYAPDWPEGAVWGGVTNVRNMWDTFTHGGASCLGEAPLSLTDHGDAAAYLDGSAADSFDVARAMRVLHVLRRERACAEGLVDCRFPAEEVDALAAAMIDLELGRIADWPWSTFGFPMDLRTREPMRVYATLADVLWDELDEEQHARLSEVMGEQIDGFDSHYEDRHWALYNGNNWTPVIAEAALTWAIAYYHEDARAPEVARRALDVLWLHRDHYLDDGVYVEGLLMYSQVSFDPLVQTHRLAEHAFGLNLGSVPWERMPAFSAWTMAFMAPDGGTVDFSDAWSKRGWGTFMPLLAHMADPVSGGFGLEPDPCFTARFFSNKYYFHGLADPWLVHPALARDWAAIVEACDEDLAREGLEVAAWTEGGWGSARVGLPGTTALAASADAPASRLGQADEVMVAVSAIPNAHPHTELDFGTLVWTAFGNRLLVDPGYGTLGGERYATEPDAACDQNPTGHNTLVVPEALLDGDPSTNTSQIEGEAGTLSVEELDGHSMLVLDGSAVYGRDDAELGWLDHFERRILPLESGVTVVIDDFVVRADRGTAAVEERWHVRRPADPSPSVCIDGLPGAELVVTPSSLTIAPQCSMLEDVAAESAGRIAGLSVEAGGFEVREWIPFFDRLEDELVLQRAAWAPSAPVASDLRVFALVPGTGLDTLPEAALRWSEPCDSDRCATLAVDGVDTLTLGFSGEGPRTLTSVSRL